MAQDSRSEFCPRCQLTQPTFEFVEETHTVRRCQMCGFPVDCGLTLDSPPPGFPRPPDVSVLCVDDDPLIRQIVADALRSRGYRTVVAADGAAALAAVRADPPQLILLDVVMPDIDGFEVCRRLKHDPTTSDIPVILLTGASDPALNQRAFAAGAELALRKPTETGAILRTVEAALGLAALRAAPDVAFVDETPAATDLSIPMHEVLLDFWTVDGATFQARLRLHLQAESHGGPETVQDRLNDPDLFLTLTVPGEDGRVFLNKIQVIRVDVKETEWAADFAQTPGETEVQPVQVQLINGEQLTGTVRIEGPAERRRLSDFLNTQPAFLPLQGSDRLHLLQKRFIARVVARGRAS